MLRQAGHTVRVVGNGQEALDALEGEAFDVLLCDVQMPVLDDMETTRALRRREAGGSRLPIVAMTALAVVGDREKCLAAGMDAYVAKPIRWHVLQEALRQVVGARALPPVLDREVILERMDGQAHLIPQLLDLFRAGYPDLVGDMRRALAEVDGERLHRAAHKLAGGLGIFEPVGPGLTATRQLEAMGRGVDLCAAPPTLDFLESHIKRLVAALETWAEQMGPTPGSAS